MPDLDISTPSPEAVLWKGHTSQWVHFWYYFFCALLAAGALAGVPFHGWTVRRGARRAHLHVDGPLVDYPDDRL